jgi:type II secretory pathway pseudopilin PulG
MESGIYEVVATGIPGSALVSVPPVKTLIQKLKLSCRRNTGLYMLELLIALATSSALAAALVSNLAETQRFTTSGQENIMAFAVAQEIMDMARNLPFGSLGANTETVVYQMQVNRLTPADPPSDSPFVHALLIDNTNPNVTWSDAAQKNLFDGSATLEVSPKDVDLLGNTVSKRLKVTVRWPSENPVHTYEMNTIISSNGIHN